MKLIKIGCELSNQCYNYKLKCENCNKNWEIEWEERFEYEDHSCDEYID